MRGLVTLSFFSILMASACGGDETESLPKVDCTTGAVPTYTALKTTALTKCLGCHTSTVTGAAHLGKPGVDYDTYALAVANAKSGASEINDGSMPEAPYTMDETEKQAYYKWALCGTPQ